MKPKDIITLFLSVMLCLAAVSCAPSGPEPPRPGTPPFLWAVAQEAHKAGDYLKTNTTLDQLLRTKSEFTPKVLPWKITIGTGLVQGYIDVADSYDKASRVNSAMSDALRKQASAFRTQGRGIAVESAEAAHTLLSTQKDASNITLAFGPPLGQEAEPEQVKKLAAGVVLLPAERDVFVNTMLQRAVLRNVSRSVGAPGDAAKTRALLETGEFQVPREAFFLGLAENLYDASQLFTRTRLDEPDKLQALCGEAQEALQLAASKDKRAKELGAKIERALKKKT